jgi:hypothetical protein
VRACRVAAADASFIEEVRVRVRGVVREFTQPPLRHANAVYQTALRVSPPVLHGYFSLHARNPAHAPLRRSERRSLSLALSLGPLASVRTPYSFRVASNESQPHAGRAEGRRGGTLRSGGVHAHGEVVPETPHQRARGHPRTAMKKLRIAILGFGTWS